MLGTKKVLDKMIVLMVSLEGDMKAKITMREGVQQEVLALIKRRVQPGTPVTMKDVRSAYNLVRVQAIADTLFWKRMHITIER